MSDRAHTPKSRPVGDVVRRLIASAARQDPTLDDVLAGFGARSFLPALMVPALIVVSPLSGIPLLPSVCGLTIALIAVQMMVPRRQHLWLPRWIARRPLNGQRISGAAARLERIADWLDGHARERFRPLVRTGPGRFVLAALCALSGLAMPFLELVPFSSSILGLAVLLIATGLLTRDGLFAACGLMAIAVAPAVPLWVIDWLRG